MKLGQLYNMPAMDRFCDSAAAAQRFGDAEAGVILARNLTAIDPTIFEKKFPELTFLNSGIELDNTGGYARRIQSLRLIEQGGFKTAGDASGNKGKISLAGEDSFLPVVVRESESTWGDDEIKEAELQNVNLPQRYVQSHNRIYQRELDEIGLVGMSDQGIAAGLLNNTHFVSASASGAAGTLTGLELYNELASLITDQRNGVNNTPEYMGMDVALPTRVFNIADQLILNSAAGAMSVMASLRANFPGVRFHRCPRADTTAAGGNLATSATVVYSTNPEAMKMRIPVPLTIGEIIKVGSFDFKVDSKYRIAGLDILESTAGRILTGL